MNFVLNRSARAPFIRCPSEEAASGCTRQQRSHGSYPAKASGGGRDEFLRATVSKPLASKISLPMAGYTRGAFYANFKSKEDIFVALLEDLGKSPHRGGEGTARARRKGQQKPCARCATHYAQIAKDRRLALLSLEFKLIRYPASRGACATARSPAALSRIGRRASEPHREPSPGRTLPIPGTAAAAGLGALSNALLLEHLVDHVDGHRRAYPPPARNFLRCCPRHKSLETNL